MSSRYVLLFVSVFHHTHNILVACSFTTILPVHFMAYNTKTLINMGTLVGYHLRIAINVVYGRSL